MRAASCNVSFISSVERNDRGFGYHEHPAEPGGYLHVFSTDGGGQCRGIGQAGGER